MIFRIQFVATHMLPQAVLTDAKAVPICQAVDRQLLCSSRSVTIRGSGVASFGHGLVVAGF